MPTASDLIDINQLVTTDTFNQWLATTNEIVAALNPLQVYDVDVGLTGGLAVATGLSAGNYNGVATISIQTGPGIGTRTFTDGKSHAIIDFGQFDSFGLAATAGASGYYVLPGDEFIFNAASDYSGGPNASGNPATSGTTKKVLARNMLPSVLDLPSGGLNLNGDVTIGGSLTINGNNTFVATNDLRIEDKQIELAYQSAVPISLTGVTGTSFTLGVTAYHFSDISGTTSDVQGYIQSYTGPMAGTTGVAVVGYPFGTNQSVDSFTGLTGYLSLSSTGSTRFLVTSIGSQQNSFLNDNNLTEAGILVKGASSDKSLLWIYNDADTGLKYDAWMSSVNIGLDDTDGAFIGRVYRSFGYTGINQSQFIFASEASKTPEIYITSLKDANSPLQFTGGTWKISKEANNVLTFAVGSTGIDSLSTAFSIASGASGTTFSGVTAYNFANRLNVDMLDGAHGYTSPTAYSIPVANAYGRIDENWLDASSVRRQYTVTSHGLTAGDVVRFDSTGTIVKAIATNSEYAEAVGIVSSVESTDVFTLTFKGRVTGLSGAVMTVEGTSLTAGQVYFLSAGVTGKLIADPDLAAATRLESGEIRKPMLLATSSTEGLVLSYVGSKIPDATDMVYLSGVVPVGSIYPFAGNLAYVTNEWLLCDGDAYRALDYPDLYTVIGRAYDNNITFASSGITGTMSGGMRGLVAGDIVTIDGATAAIVSVSEANSRVVVDRTITSGTKTINAYSNSTGESMFFVPDLRTRVPMGGSTGSSDYTSTGLSGYSVGDFGGSENITLSIAQLPAHTHALSASTIASSGAGSNTVVSGGGSINTSSVGSGSAVDVHSPYLVTHFIIRATKGTGATILTGHDHDERYVRFDNAPTLQTAFGTSGGATAANFRSKIGVYGTSEVYNQTESNLRFYATADADSRFINNGGDTGLSGTYLTVGDFLLDTTTDSTDTIGIRGIANVYIASIGDGNGLNVLAPSTIVGEGSGDYNVLKVFGTNAPTDSNSRTEVYVNGDFTVAGNYLSGSGISAHNEPVFGVDPLVCSVYIAGGFTSGAGYDPTLVFSNPVSPSDSIGRIYGLTAPVADSEAANKWYVDKVSYFTEQSTSLSGHAAGHEVTGLDNGIWYVAVHGSTESSLASNPVSIGLTMNGGYMGLIVTDRDDANSTPISLSTVLEITDNTLTIDSLQDMYVHRIVGYKVGTHT